MLGLKSSDPVMAVLVLFETNCLSVSLLASKTMSSSSSNGFNLDLFSNPRTSAAGGSGSAYLYYS